MNRIIGLVTVICLNAVSIVSATDYYWNFDDAIQGTNAMSSESPTGDFSLMNSTTWHPDGISGNCLEFTFSNNEADYIQVPDNTFAKCLDRFTWSFWVYPYTSPSSTQLEMIFAKSYNSTLGGSKRAYHISLVNGQFKFSVCNDGINWDYPGAPFGPTGIQPNQWHHVAVTWDKNNGMISGYVDGQKTEIGMKTTSIYDYDFPLEIGRYSEKYNQDAYSFKGRIDECKIFDRALTELEIMSLYHEFNLVAHYKLNNGSGTTVTDETGINNGTITGTATWVDGQEGSALSFDGTSNFVSCGNDASVDITGPVTVSAWFKRDAAWVIDGYYHPIVSKSSIYNDNGFGLHIYCRNIGSEIRPEFWTRNGTTYQSVYASHFDMQWGTNEWMHLVGVADGQNYMLYINGELVQTVASTQLPSSSSDNLFIGWDNNSNSSRWSDLIDEVAVYNSALSASEILDLYNSLSQSVQPSSVCEWQDINGGIGYGEGNVQIGDYDYNVRLSGTKIEMNNLEESNGVTQNQNIELNMLNSTLGMPVLDLKSDNDDGAMIFNVNARVLIPEVSDNFGADVSALAVDGTIQCKKLKVSSSGADFVFENGYKLLTLAEVEHHINMKKHLPEIPSADEMQKNGMEVSEMQTKLLQKVEELTLYLIEQNKRIEKLEDENKALRNN